MNPQYMQMMMSQMNQAGQGGQMPQMMMNNMMNQGGRPQGNHQRQYQHRGHRTGGQRQHHQQRQQQPAVAKVWTLDHLKENLPEFMDFDMDKKRSILGELLFPQIKGLLKTNDENAPKITGMLIDFEVFEVSDIIEFLESKDALLERVKEAEELISQQP